MDKAMNKVRKAYVAAAPQNLLIAAVAIIVLVFATLYVKKHGFRMERFTNASTKVIFYSMDGCPHCVAFQAEWDTFVASPPPGVITEQIKSDDKRAQSAGINGFPTITIASGSDDPVTYQGARTAAALTQFIANA